MNFNWESALKISVKDKVCVVETLLIIYMYEI